MQIDKIVFSENYQGYLVTDSNTKEAILIDPFQDETKIQAAMDNVQAQVKSIVLTQYSQNHASSSAIPYLLRQYGLEIIIHENDSENLNLGSRDSAKMEIQGGESLNIAGTPLKLIFTPGVTAGSISILIQNHLFIGGMSFENVHLPSDPFLPYRKEDVYKGFRRLAKLPLKPIVHSGLVDQPQDEPLQKWVERYPILKTENIQDFMAVAKG